MRLAAPLAPWVTTRGMSSSASSLSNSELVASWVQCMREMRTRGLVRSSNNPVADLGESLAARALNLVLASNSEKGFDASDAERRRYQVKSRRITPENRSTQLSAVRGLKSGDPFDYLIAIYFNEDFSVREVRRIEVAAIRDHCSYGKHTNSHKVVMSAKLREDKRSTDMTELFRAAWMLPE